MADNKFNTAGVSSTSTQVELTVKDLMPNNYLTIVWKDTATGKIASTLDINDEKASEYTISLNNAIDRAINSQKINYFGQNKYIDIQSIAKYIAQNTIEAGVQRSIVNALIGIATGNAKKTPDAIVNLCLNGFGTIADKVARSLGWTDPHNVFSQVAGENVISVFRELGNKTRDFLEDKIKDITKTKRTSVSTTDKQTGKQYVGLILGLTTSDQESYEITIPRKKVEKGSDYTTHLLPQPFKKDFTVNLTNKILNGNFDRTIEIDNIEKIKDKLIEIAKSHTLFDIYIRLSPEKMYKRTGVSFSSLSFTKDENTGNGYTSTFSVEPVNEFETKVFVSNKKYGSSKGSGSTGIKSSDRKQNEKTTDGKSLQAWAENTRWKYEFDSYKKMRETCKQPNFKKDIIIFPEDKQMKYVLTTTQQNNLIQVSYKTGLISANKLNKTVWARRQDCFWWGAGNKWVLNRGVNVTTYNGREAIKSGKTIYFIDKVN